MPDRRYGRRHVRHQCAGRCRGLQNARGSLALQSPVRCTLALSVRRKVEGLLYLCSKTKLAGLCGSGASYCPTNQAAGRQLYFGWQVRVRMCPQHVRASSLLSLALTPVLSLLVSAAEAQVFIYVFSRWSALAEKHGEQLAVIDPHRKPSAKLTYRHARTAHCFCLQLVLFRINSSGLFSECFSVKLHTS